MNIVYAAEKPTIASLLSDHVKRRVQPADIQVTANPEETGSFFIRWQFDRYVLAPNGEVSNDVLSLVD